MRQYGDGRVIQCQNARLTLTDLVSWSLKTSLSFEHKLVVTTYAKQAALRASMSPTVPGLPLPPGSSFLYLDFYINSTILPQEFNKCPL